MKRITASRNGGWGIDNQSQQTFTTHVVGCEALANGFGVVSTGGIRVGESALVTDCVSRGTNGHGFATSGGFVRFVSCVSIESGADGFNSAGTETSLTNCTVGQAGAAAVRVGDRASLVECTISQTAGAGVVLGSLAKMTGCNVKSFGVAITALDDCVFADCTLTASAALGVSARDGNHFVNCRVSGCAGDGFNVRFGNRFEGCQSRSNQGDGIESNSGGHILSCTLDGNGSGATVGANIRITGDACRIEGNSLIGGDFGIQTTSGGNVIVRNSSRNSGNSYGGISGGNDVGPIGSAATATSPWANIQY
ncbi:MAG: right-handed parallel beta-helix repeat-containing protein [Phycisphaerales bacterium]